MRCRGEVGGAWIARAEWRVLRVSGAECGRRLEVEGEERTILAVDGLLWD